MSTEPGKEVVQILSDYLAVTQQLLHLVGEAQELPDMERLDKLLAEREQLIEVHRQFPDTSVDDPDVQAKWLDIQQAEATISVALDALRANMKGKMNTLQKQKLGLNAYRQMPKIGAAFIDSRK